ncbi:MAG: bifunctional deaminase-reductase domain protein [Actinomycetia bacterium]|nr:bifunctional deaminase-reductase domain protein [Actinomycetes bacterium]
MRKLIVTEFVTLDGVMEAPGGEPTHPHTGWVEPYIAGDPYERKFQEVLDCESHLLGRVTYESFVGAWPTREGPMADRINSMAKHVVSTTMTTAEWNNTEVLPNLDAVRALKDGDGGDILVAGSHTLVHALLREELVDQLTLMVFPVTIGGGLRLFPDSTQKWTWAPIETESFDNGVIFTKYAKA